MTVPANADKATEQEQISIVSTQSKEADFETLCTGVTLNATEACYIAFDRPANTGDFLLLADTMIDIPDVQFTRLSAIAVSTGGVLYILARR